MKTASYVLAALAAVSLAACASRPKPMGPVATNTPPPPPPMENGSAYPVPPRGDVSETGAPTPGSQRDLLISAGDLVYFDFDRYEVRGDARQTLDKQAAWLGRYPQIRVRIEGNCDDRGTRDYNFALGARRAEAVKAYLVERGVPSSRVDTISYGKEKPLYPSEGDGEEAGAKNRNAHTVVQ